MYYLFLYIFAPHVSGAICTHLQEHKLQSTALGVCNVCGMLVHWSRYWLGHPHTFSTVKSEFDRLHRRVDISTVDISTRL
jgi:hypothetical protein